MTERDAWDFIATIFAPKNGEKSDGGDWFYSTVRDWEYMHAWGMCDVIHKLNNRGLISDRLEQRMLKKIEKIRETFNVSLSYVYPLTPYGARKRRQFCKKMIEELSKPILKKSKNHA